jgi:hypothetical protein
LPLVEKPGSMDEAVLPLVPVRGDQPARGWQLVPHFLDASPPDISYSIRITTPVIEGDTAPQHATFNQAVQAQIDDWLGAYSVDQMGTPQDDLGWFVDISYQLPSGPDWLLAMPFAISSKAPETLSPAQATFLGGHETLSTLFEDFAYLGGAHPGTFYLAINYDTTTRKILSLADLFEPGTDYLGLVSSLCIAELQTRSELLFPDFATHGAAPMPENYQTWAITPNGLLVVFQEYQVAPYVAGAQTVLIPYQALAEQLDPSGPLSFFAK